MGVLKYPEKIGCIEIGDNVFIGAGTSINYNVKIGSNVIIGACSLITKDVPDNCVVAGVPAKVICSFEEYIERRSKDSTGTNSGTEEVSFDIEAEQWRLFNNARQGNT